jgi:hypothetical protein
MATAARTVLLLCAFSAFVTACGSPTADGNATAAGQSACDQAFAQAIAIDSGSDTVSAIDGAIAGCRSLQAWVRAAEQTDFQGN